MRHRVNYTTKIVDESDPNYKLLAEKTKNFQSFTRAMEFIRELKSNSREVLVGRPILEEAA